MKIINIREKLSQLGMPTESFNLGDFDIIGKYTAERQRDRSSSLYKTVGAFYRSNYERGILISALIKKYNISSVLEIGFGRGYSSICAAKALDELGLDAKIFTIDPNFDKNHISMLKNIFPSSWMERIVFYSGSSRDVLPEIDCNFDLVYIDGDHSYEGTKYDWEMCKNKWNKCLLFDDYHLPSKFDPGIQCRDLIDSIDHPTKELILMDRRIFFDDRQISDEDLDYGQVLLTNTDMSVKM